MFLNNLWNWIQSLLIDEEQELQVLDVPLGKLSSLDKYAQFEDKGEVRQVGYTETTHGCKHLCTHCPIPPVYNGKFFPVPQENSTERNTQTGSGRCYTYYIR